MITNNLKMLQTVAVGLGELKNDVVFVGGAVAELYADDPAASDIRPTLDVDCVIELRSRIAFGKFEEALRAKRFVNDNSNGAPICRWIFKNIKVDVMPDIVSILGFTNIWYNEGIENKTTKVLPDKTEIFVFPPEYYLASKFEAHKNRGGKDLRQSHDFEDIIYILDNCLGILQIISASDRKVKDYLKLECQNLFNKDNLSEGIESALPHGSGKGRAKIIEDLLGNISGL